MEIPTVYLASVLLEPNRWKPNRPPSLQVSDWTERAAAAGFAGWELFENHYHGAPMSERARLENGKLRVEIFNSYASLDEPEALGIRMALDEAAQLGAKQIKFNVGSNAGNADADKTLIQEIISDSKSRSWPSLLCECHPGTLLETPRGLVDFTARWKTWPFEIILHPFLLTPDEIREWGRLVGEYLAHAHVQMRSASDPRRFVSLSQDAPRAHACLEALAEIKFRGTFALEFSAPTGQPNETSETLFDAAVRDLEFLRANWLR